MTDARVRLRPEIESMVAYRQGAQARADGYKLSSNENPFPPLPAVLAALADETPNRYPDAGALVLRERLAERFDVTPDEIQVGAGSVSILTQLVTAAAGAGDEVLYAWRSFEAYPTIVTVSGATSVTVPLTADAEHDLDAMVDAITERTRLVIVCSPNNPTGPIVTAAAFAAFMRRVPRTVLVALDEAYAEFVTDPDAVDGTALLDSHPNLVVLRTFSKAYGLAGLRVGYAIGPAYVMQATRATQIPLSVTGIAQRAALVSLDHEAELLERVRQLVLRREQVVDGLRAQGWQVPDAQGNFVWLPTGDDTARAAERFAEQGLVVRAFPPEGIRISIGEAESVEKLLRCAAEVVPSR